MTTTDELIAKLGTDVHAIRPLQPPMVRTGLWLLAAFAIVCGLVLSHGLRPDLTDEFSRPAVVIEWLASLFTGLLAAVATFHVSIPGRSVRWALLPVPAVALWLATLGVGCLTDWFRYGADGLEVGLSVGCFETIVFTSVPLGLTLLLMVRHAGPVRPGPTILLGALSVAAFSAAGLSLFHHLNSSLMVLISHGSGVAFVMLTGWASSGALFRWIGLNQL